MNVLAINFNHDGAAVVLKNGEIAGYVNTERFSRRKKHPGVRETDLNDVLDQARLGVKDLDLVQLVNLNSLDSPDVPKLHGTNLKETWPDFWINKSFTQIRLLGETLNCVVPKAHHLFHAALAYYFSPFDSGVSLACDPTGAEAYFFADNRPLRLNPRRRMIAPRIYTNVSGHVFGSGLIGAGKLMALAPYGSSDRAQIDYAALAGMSPGNAYDMLIAKTTHDPVIVFESGKALNASLAFHTQAFLEFEMSGLLETLYRTCISMGLEANLCLSGGAALNSVANQRCFQRSCFKGLYVHPACGDDGTAIGAALDHWHRVLNQPKQRRSNRQAMYSLRTYEKEIPDVLRKYQDRLKVQENSGYIPKAAEMILSGNVIGWYQGASEIGPRALGNRSILADPRNPAVREYLNTKVKKRESFRPFAPSVLADESERWFGISDSPFMLKAAPVSCGCVPAVTHVDGTARVQTVAEDDNPNFYELLRTFHEKTRVPMLLNTSFNGRGEPIVETPEDAVNCMLTTGLDAVVFPGIIAARTD